MNEWQSKLKGGQGLEELLADGTYDERDLSAWISDKLTELRIPKNLVVKRSRLNQTFAYQIMAGTRNASRDKLIQLAFGMGLEPEEASELLMHGGACALRTNNRRDVIIGYCLHHKMDVATCDDKLWDHHQPTLTACSR